MQFRRSRWSFIVDVSCFVVTCPCVIRWLLHFGECYWYVHALNVVVVVRVSVLIQILRLFVVFVDVTSALQRHFCFVTTTNAASSEAFRSFDTPTLVAFSNSRSSHSCFFTLYKDNFVLLTRFELLGLNVSTLPVSIEWMGRVCACVQDLQSL